MKLQRRQFAGLVLAAPLISSGCSTRATARASEGTFSYLPGIGSGKPLIAPKGRQIRVAFAINPGFQVIDMAGPWETFQDTYVSNEAEEAAFEVFTVSETSAPVQGTGGLMVSPNYTIENAPAPDIIVVPHFAQPRPGSRDVSAIHTWIKASHEQAAMTMSVCTGAFQLAKTGLLDGVPMTTNQLAYDSFTRNFPDMDLRRGPRFVEQDRIATSGGLSAGIDLALHVVSRYFTQTVAQQTADVMEYAGTGWHI